MSEIHLDRPVVKCLKMHEVLDPDDIVRRGSFYMYVREQWLSRKTMMCVENIARKHQDDEWKIEHEGITYIRRKIETEDGKIVGEWVEEKN